MIGLVENKVIYFDDKYSLIEYFKDFIFIGIFLIKPLKIFDIKKIIVK